MEQLSADEAIAAQHSYYRYYMRMAHEEAMKSPDQSTQVGAVVLDEYGNFLGSGQNRFTDGMVENGPKTLEELLTRPTKYTYVSHGERNSLYDAVQRGAGSDIHTLVCPWSACAECAKTIVQIGVKRLVRAPFDSDEPGGWKFPGFYDSVIAGDEMIRAAGIEIIEIGGPLGGVGPVRLNGEDYWP
jgi:deoxycytidylate deaminase